MIARRLLPVANMRAQKIGSAVCENVLLDAAEQIK